MKSPTAKGKKQSTPVTRSADNGQNGHGGAPLESSTVVNNLGLPENASETPEIGAGADKTPEITPSTSEIGGKSVRNQAVRSRTRDPETGNLLLREGQASIGSKLDDVMEQRICKCIAEGLSLLDSCRICDLDDSTLWRWKAKGEEQPGSRYAKFLQAVVKAEATCKQTLVTRCARDEDWRSAAFLLKAKWPAEFIERTELTAADGTPLTIGNTAFKVVFELPNLDEPLNWETVDHRSDEQKSESLAEISGHKPSQPLPPSELPEFTEDPPKLSIYDPLGARLFRPRSKK